MAAATAVALSAPFPALTVFRGTCTLNPASIAAAGREEQTIAVPGVKVSDVASVAPRAALEAGLVISHVRCAAGSISFYLENHSAGAVDAASQTWDFEVRRGSEGVAATG